jgi:hypothetical protein
VTNQLWYQTLSIGIDCNCVQALHEVGEVFSPCGDGPSDRDDFYGINDVRCIDVNTGIGHGVAVQDREKQCVGSSGSGSCVSKRGGEQV